MDKLLRGADGDPLPDGEWVKRACKKKLMTLDGDISEKHFEPSSEDKKDSKNRLTVWAARITDDDHVLTLSNNNMTDSIIARLNVDAIRAVRPDPENDAVASLEVEWHHDERPDAQGHAGIRDLVQVGIATKAQKRSLWLQLAMLAEANRTDRPKVGQQADGSPPAAGG